MSDEAAVLEAAPAVAAAPAATTEPSPTALLTAEPVVEASILAPAVKPLVERIPEKYRVLKDDGTLDTEASLAKVDDARAALEKRMGTGDAPPKTAEEYKINLPDNLKVLGEALDSAQVKAFQAEAHAKGLTQAQLDFVMEKYLMEVPRLVQAQRGLDNKTAVEELRKEWTSDEIYDAAVGRSHRALAEFAGTDAESIIKDYGNDPRIVRMLAKVGETMGADSSPSPAGSGSASTQSAQDYLRDNFAAYSNARDPQHARVTAEYNRLISREVPHAHEAAF